MDTSRQIARRLLEVGAVKLQPQDPFTWASGLRSPIYCDNRVLLSYPAIRSEVVSALAGAAGAIHGIEGIAGVATAGIPHGALVADRLGLPFIYVRSSAKEHGRRNQIEGRLETGRRYLIVEDLISTGGSSLKAAEVVRAGGGGVAGAQAIFTYQFPSADRAFQHAEVPLTTVTNYGTLVEEAASMGTITDDEAATLADWRQDPRAWSDAFSD
ncbi:orotate phosphoribosyltransferase [Lewinella sp. JB7]|uniref:orotate phosphoribosyltransferase n=1 Tax=Lewinella sp. JB7 TaxID=2962887 RepID=UPI0020CA01D1|nr:orotate phosphoribosyltransferase [Lewinella sp. JB7]MCP9235823.1 orotate phosphoribosyltransferase [Lewinella sp. JB7]